MDKDAELKNSIKVQRVILTETLSKSLKTLAKKCSLVWGDCNKINQKLSKGFKKIPYCTNLYVMKIDGIQVSANICKGGLLSEYRGIDRSARPYMLEIKAGNDFLLSSAYISLNASRPSITAIQRIKKSKKTLGLLAVDIDLRDLPVSTPLYEESGQWRQIKGDPSIRSTVFQQTRIESAADRNSENILTILEELFIQRGVFQSVIHYSSSRCTIWIIDDPYKYRILEADSFTNIETCMAYPLHSYPENAIIPENNIKDILQKLQKLRLADDTLYLRSSSINIFNGLISLTFSCDGSHYLPYDQFLEKDISFWGYE